ncbi:MAG: TIR domain-containing protein [Endomicrobium sp.]|nr:TIR domain-containing protein [Endomicrobium sp.]
MTTPRAFISFDYDNNSKEKILFSGQIRNSRTPFDIEDWSSKEQIFQSEWEREIRDKINRCNLLIVLVGTQTHRAKGVLKEISFAKNQNVPIFGIYIDNASQYSTLPEGLLSCKTISWDWDKIAQKISECMQEGKNG